MSLPLLYVTEIYQCSKSGCRKTLLGDADAILQQCPRAVANSLPILKTQKYGVCHDLADLILSIATTSMSISELHTTLEVYAMRYQLRNIKQSTKQNSAVFIFLVHYESHFIIVSFDGSLLRYWDSLESHAPWSRMHQRLAFPHCR